MDSLSHFATDKLDRLNRKNLQRNTVASDRSGGAVVRRNGRKLISFSCNDYLGLSQHPRVKAAAIEATNRFGVGAGASRLVTGNHSLYGALEESLAEIKGVEAVCVFGSGYLVNAGVIPCFAGRDDLIVVDELSHACLLAGSALGGAAVMRFTHNDTDQLRDLLAAHRHKYGRCLVVTEGVFSMDGDLAPLPEISAISESFDAWLMCDDAHGFGVVGNKGRGSVFAHGAHVNVPLQTGTLSKAVGAYGGYVCGAQPVIDLIKSRARTLIYSTGLPPATLAAALGAIELIREDADLCAVPLEKARLFCRELGLPEPRSCIVPIVIGDAAEALSASRELEEQGFLVIAIRPPSVPENTSRLRLTFSAMHRNEDIIALAHCLRRMGLAGNADLVSAEAV